MEETKYYVFDCDTDLYKLTENIDNIFKEIHKKNPRAIHIEYGYADMIVDGECSCCLFPNDEISIIFGIDDITFNATNKILKLEIDNESSICGVIYNIKVEIIDKG